MRAVAVETRRGPVLASAPMLVGFAFFMGIVATVVCPTGREYAELEGEQAADAYSIAYLTVLTRAEPNDVHLRVVYVRQLAQLGRWDEALDAVERAPGGSRSSVATLSLRLELLLAKARSMPIESPERVHAFRAVHAELTANAERLPTTRTRELAELALELEDPRLAARLFTALADAAPPGGRAVFLADAGRWFRAAGDGERAAASYQRAADDTGDDDARKNEYLLGAATALEASQGACAAATSLAPSALTSTDTTLVRRAVAALRGCGRASDAKSLGRRLVTLTGDDSAEIKTQVARELEAGDAPGALSLLRQLLVRDPRNPALHETTARVAEWAGQPQVALREWVWVLDSGRAPSAKLTLP